MTISEARPDSTDAHRLLTDYFSWRSAEFPSAEGSYTTTYPDPLVFMPPDGVFLVVAGDDNDSDTMVGCGGIRRIDPDGRARQRFEIKHVWLAPESRGRGLADALMEELELRARTFGAELIVLDTHDSLTGAARLYARRGYTPVDAYNDNPNATVWYQKDLTTTS